MELNNKTITELINNLVVAAGHTATDVEVITRTINDHFKDCRFSFWLNDAKMVDEEAHDEDSLTEAVNDAIIKYQGFIIHNNVKYLLTKATEAQSCHGCDLKAECDQGDPFPCFEKSIFKKYQK